MEFKKEELIKSPLNYVGGKFKLLPQILPLFPNNIDMFIDLFGGGFNVGINVKANKIIYNDSCRQITELLSTMKLTKLENQLTIIKSYINKYNLSKENKEGFIELRKEYNKSYNKSSSTILLYTLICYSFNNQIRFNSKNEYNMPFGKNRSSFNPTLENKYIKFVNELHNKNINFFSKDFRELKINHLKENDFVYIDPPYYNSNAAYNEQNGWTEQDEKDLLNLLDQLNNKNIKFALSNNFKYDNPFLNEWSNKYNIHYLNYDYSNCNYHKKDKSKDIEVLITNY